MSRPEAGAPVAAAARRAGGAAGPWTLDLDVERAVEVRRTGLVLPDDLGIDAWRRLGEQLLVVCEASGWWLGDWLVFGERRYPDRYRQAVRATALDYQTLRNYAWAARRFPPSRRRAGLSLQHHVAVAALPPDEQDHWLDFAQRLGWSRDELRRQVRDSVAGDDDGHDRPAHLSLSLDRDRLGRWRAAAGRADLDLVEWVVRALDAAADRGLEEPHARRCQRWTGRR